MKGPDAVVHHIDLRQPSSVRGYFSNLPLRRRFRLPPDRSLPLEMPSDTHGGADNHRQSSHYPNGPVHEYADVFGTADTLVIHI